MSNAIELGEQMLQYCRKFNIPLEYLFEILEDQKVSPMIRGKAMEYNAFMVLDKLLPRNVWSVQKLNLNPQPGISDEDISITHRRTGIILKVESKSTVRGSFSDGARSRVHKAVSHFKVKCHRSRSNISLASTSNDRYSVNSFDVILTNTSNAIFEGNTTGEYLEILHNETLRTALYKHYSVETEQGLIAACENDWRFCMPSDIAEDGFIPRTPYVMLADDPNWRPVKEIEARLSQLIEEKKRNPNQIARRN